MKIMLKNSRIIHIRTRKDLILKRKIKVCGHPISFSKLPGAYGIEIFSLSKKIDYEAEI